MPTNFSNAIDVLLKETATVYSYSTAATLRSACGCGVDTVSEGTDLVSFVATPTPRHKGHAFRPDPNH
jgi:hypothetical protein